MSRPPLRSADPPWRNMRIYFHLSLYRVRWYLAIVLLSPPHQPFPLKTPLLQGGYQPDEAIPLRIIEGKAEPHLKPSGQHPYWVKVHPAQSSWSPLTIKKYPPRVGIKTHKNLHLRESAKFRFTIQSSY